MKKFPSFSQWRQIFKVLKKGEIIALLACSSLAFASLVFLAGSFYVNNTNIVPAVGGTFTEHVVGQPRFINPVYGETNDIDRALIDLVFSGLMAYDREGNITEDLAQNHSVSQNGKIYEFTLKNNIFWHDGKMLTADDVVFTIKTIQNSDYKSPLRANWIDVEVEKLSEKSVRFILKTPYNSFLENLTVKIIPKHIWESISPENAALSFYNLQPVGSGPFAFAGINQTSAGLVKTLALESNRRHQGGAPFISKIAFQFHEKKEDISQKGTSAYSFFLPRYFAVFFNNQKNSLFADKNMRKALSYAVNRQALAQKIAGPEGEVPAIIDSPILPGFFGYQKPANTYEFDTALANSLLDKTGFIKNAEGQRQKSTTKKPSFQFTAYLRTGSKGSEVTQLQACLAKLDENFKTMLAPETNGTYGKITESTVTQFQKTYLPSLAPTGETGTSTRKKLNELCFGTSTNSQALAFTLTTVNQPELIETANLLKQYWESTGAQVTIKAVSLTDLKPIIKNRDYDALLYGEALGAQPDFYPFWHSSQRFDPGLNLSSYENKEVDKLLKEARETMDLLAKEQKLERMQNIIIEDAPALFLYNPSYVYRIANKVRGIENEKIIDPAKRFAGVATWYIKTKRAWK